jgi:uncharacterized protein YabN with tetrapyrrole methylase and pyrophosphatase domain
VPEGSLTVVGTGIQLGTHMTLEARSEIERADELLFLVSDPVMVEWIERINPKARSLHTLYTPGKRREQAYALMVEEMVGAVRRGSSVCAAFYGHPGIYAFPSHEAIRRLREEGFRARMLPGVSAEDCLFADLGVDPGATGCQSYEATDFVMNRRLVDPAAALILWQISAVGILEYAPTPTFEHLPVLVDYLLEHYPAEHEVVVYEASPYPVSEPLIVRLPLADVSAARVTPLATLFVPPRTKAQADPAMLRRLDLAG